MITKKQLIEIQEQSMALYDLLRQLWIKVGKWEFVDRLTISEKIGSPLSFLLELTDRLDEWAEDLEE